MALVLASGVVFWGTIAFFGTRKMFTERTGPLIEPLAGFKARMPKLLPAIGIAGPLIAAAWVAREVLSIQRTEGYVGPSFLIAVLFGVAGAVALSAHLFLET